MKMFFDIGSNVGNWSIANICPLSKIVAVEADPDTFMKLKSKTSKFENIVCLNFAVCNSKNEFVEFFKCQTDTLSTLNKEWLTSTDSRFYNYKYTPIICKTISLDKLIEMYGVPELIKIDVEGGEFECITSLTQTVNNICFEWASETNDVTIKCLDYLVTLGYTQFSIQFEDNYTYRPLVYNEVDAIKDILKKTTPKKEWGMIWAKV